MRRSSRVHREGDWNPALAIDRVVLDAADRQRRRIVLTGECGTTFLLDLASPVTLCDGDGLELDNGAVVRVAGQSEPVVEITASTPLALVRIAWHLGNRHADVQVCDGRLRIRRDHVLEEMARVLGAELIRLEVSFEPEPVAGSHQHGHSHQHNDP